MKLLQMLIVFASLAAYHGCEEEDSSTNNETSRHASCPVWTTLSNNTCKCGSSLNGIVHCNRQTLSVTIPLCYCISYNELTNTSVIGNCLFGCDGHLRNKTSKPCKFRYSVHSSEGGSIAEMNRNLCRRIQKNRTGQLCGKCQEGFAPGAYSYTMECVECKDYKYNWLKYIAVAFLPLTLFYIVVIVFRVSASSGVLNGYILVCQILTAPGVYWIIYYSPFRHTSSHSSNKIISLIVSFHGIWNLDFFRPAYSPFCLHPSSTILHIQALEYTIAIYPLLLILLTYMFVTLHDRYPLVVRLWKPFYKCFVLIRKEWDIKPSLINVFATFLLLSSVKFLNISFSLLTPVTLTDLNNTQLSQRYLYMDGSIRYFGKEHLPFALLATFVLTIFNIIPFLLLCLYPCRYFHKCLNKLRLQSQVILTFMDAFQGSYKSSPRDFRHFAAIFYLIRIVNVAFPVFFLNTKPLMIPINGMILVSVSILIAMTKPYRKSAHNCANVLILVWVSFFSLSYPIYVYLSILNHETLHLFGSVFIGTLILIMVIFDIWFLCYLLMPKRIAKSLVKFITKCCRQTTEAEAVLLPYRLKLMDEYAPLQ